MRHHYFRGAKLMRQHYVGGLEGILTEDDLLALFGEEIVTLTRVAGREQERERQLRG